MSAARLSVPPSGLPSAVFAFVLVAFARLSDVVLSEAPLRRSGVVPFRLSLTLLSALVSSALMLVLRPTIGLTVLLGPPATTGLLMSVGLRVLSRLPMLSGLPTCTPLFETVGLMLVVLLAALVHGSPIALLTALEPAGALFVPLSTLSVPFVLLAGASAAAPEDALLVVLGLLTSPLVLLVVVLLMPMLLPAALLPAVLLVLPPVAAEVASALTLRRVSLILVPVLVSLLRSSLSVLPLSASSLSALSVLSDVGGFFVLVVCHG